jgi:hypothetical protein
MTTATRVAYEPVDMGMPWDLFLEKSLEDYPEAVRDVQIVKLRRTIMTFRGRDWKTMRREAMGLGISLPDGLEPHWVAPGKAIMWHRPVTRHLRPADPPEANGRQRIEGRDEVGPWTPSSVLAMANVTNLIYQLKKGLRLRPPLGEDVEASSMALLAGSKAEPLQTSSDSSEIEEYVCDRHPSARGPCKFVSWKAYHRHCEETGEPMEYTPPARVMSALDQCAYVCPVCYQGFQAERAMKLHCASEQARPKYLLSPHPGPSKMLVKTSTAVQLIEAEAAPLYVSDKAKPPRKQKRRNRNRVKKEQ